MARNDFRSASARSLTLPPLCAAGTRETIAARVAPVLLGAGLSKGAVPVPKRGIRVALAALMAAAVIVHTPRARAQEFNPIIRGDGSMLAARGLLADRDDDFIKHAARADAIEIQTARLAMTKASSADVKAFAERLVSDHTATSAHLAEWAAKKHVVLKDDDPDVKMKWDKHASLQTRTGVDFDRAFVDAVIEDHSDQIVLYMNERRKTQDAGLKTFADETVRTVRAHLKTAWDLRAALLLEVSARPRGH